MERQNYSGVDDIEHNVARETFRSPVSSLGDERSISTHQYSVEEKLGNDHDHGIDWNPGWRNQWPWVGFAGFITLIVATAMAIAILGVSNHKRVKDWPFETYPIQPNVLLNIANQVQNLGLITMIGQGLAIAWWRKALKGSSLETLHRNHAYSYSFYAIITSGRKFNIVALAALMTKFAVVDSTLFQKVDHPSISHILERFTDFIPPTPKGDKDGYHPADRVHEQLSHSLDRHRMAPEQRRYTKQERFREPHQNN